MLTGEAKKQWQREYKRRKREETQFRETHSGETCNCRRWGEGIPVYIPPHSVADHDAAVAGKAVVLPSTSAPLFSGPVTRPKEATDAEWNYALLRAERATTYATKFPDHVLAHESVYQSPIWQWQNETRGR
jgi:hypothetical protein